LRLIARGFRPRGLFSSATPLQCGLASIGAETITDFRHLKVPLAWLQRGRASIARRRLAALKTARLSRDLDVFHDTIEAVDRSWTADRTSLELDALLVGI
jgi:hypothetical protein